jgi:hypothetical protein
MKASSPDEPIIQQNHWSERGRATSVPSPATPGRPHRSVLALVKFRAHMKRFTAVAVVSSIAGICCIVAATVAIYYYNLYRTARTELEQRVEQLERSVNSFGQWHQFQDLVPSRVRGHIITGPASNADSVFEISASKIGPVVNGTLILRAGSTEKQEFNIRTEHGYGRHAVEAWLLHTEPADASAAFQEFWVYCPKHTNVLRVVVQPRTNTPLDMTFTLGLLREVP